MLTQCSLLPPRPVALPQQLLDAHGQAPAPLSGFERRVAQATQSGLIAARQKELARKQALPLEEKINLSRSVIRDWYEAWDGQVSVSYSGGKDSSLLLWQPSLRTFCR